MEVEGEHCYNKWKSGVHTSFPNIQFLHKFENDHGFYAIMERYTFYPGRENKEELARAMKLKEVKAYLENFWGWENFQQHYGNKHLIFSGDTFDRLHAVRIIDMLHEDARDMLLRNEWDGPVFNAMKDVYQHSNLSLDFGDAMSDMIDVCSANNTLPDLHQGNIAFWGSGSKIVLADPIGFTQAN